MPQHQPNFLDINHLKTYSKILSSDRQTHRGHDTVTLRKLLSFSCIRSTIVNTNKTHSIQRAQSDTMAAAMVSDWARWIECVLLVFTIVLLIQLKDNNFLNVTVSWPRCVCLSLDSILEYVFRWLISRKLGWCWGIIF